MFAFTLGKWPGVSLSPGMCLPFLIPRQSPAQGRFSMPALGVGVGWGAGRTGLESLLSSGYLAVILFL